MLPDISQALTGDSVTFSANTVDADNWMTTTWGDHTVTFEMPDDHDAALAFRDNAKQRGFSIADI